MLRSPRCPPIPCEASEHRTGPPSSERASLTREPREPPTKRSSAPAVARARPEGSGQGQGEDGTYTTLFPATLPPQIRVRVQGWVSPARRGAGASWEVRRVGRKWCCSFTPRPRPELAPPPPSRSEPARALRRARGAGLGRACPLVLRSGCTPVHSRVHAPLAPTVGRRWPAADRLRAACEP